VDTRSPCITAIPNKYRQVIKETKREGRLKLSRRARLTLLSMQKASRIYTGATSIAETFANIRKCCVRFTHATVTIAETFGDMQKRRADSRTSRFSCAGGSRQIESAGFHIWALPVAVYGHPLLRCQVLSLSLLRLLFPCSKSAAS
jgi:hypothetical protein